MGKAPLVAKLFSRNLIFEFLINFSQISNSVRQRTFLKCRLRYQSITAIYFVLGQRTLKSKNLNGKGNGDRGAAN